MLRNLWVVMNEAIKEVVNGFTESGTRSVKPTKKAYNSLRFINS